MYTYIFFINNKILGIFNINLNSLYKIKNKIPENQKESKYTKYIARIELQNCDKKINTFSRTPYLLFTLPRPLRRLATMTGAKWVNSLM